VEDAKEKVQFYGSLALICLGVVAAGSVVRGESSPWLWVELKTGQDARPLADQIVTVACYLSFYSMGFLIPYLLTTFALFIRRQQLSGLSPVPPMPASHRRGRLFLSLSTLTLFLLMLDSIVAFVRALPTGEWNGWLLIGGLGTAGLLAYLAYLEFTRPDDRPINVAPAPPSHSPSQSA
jgi:hypothetical protein